MMNFKKNKENKYVKNSKDYSSYKFQNEMECDSELSSTSDCLDLLDDFGDELEDFNDKDILDSFEEFITPFMEENPDELAMLGFFNDFRLVEMGMEDFIREVYFEE